MEASQTRQGNWFWSGEEPEWLVIMTVLVALVIGGVVMFEAVGRKSTLTLEKTSIQYPANWTASETEPGTMAGAQDLASQADVTISIMRKLDPAAPVTMDDLVTERSFELGQNTRVFNVLGRDTVMLKGNSGVALSYAYVLDSSASSAYLAPIPRVIRGVDYIIPYQGSVYCISIHNDASEWQESEVARLIDSLRFH